MLEVPAKRDPMDRKDPMDRQDPKGPKGKADLLQKVGNKERPDPPETMGMLEGLESLGPKDPLDPLDPRAPMPSIVLVRNAKGAKRIRFLFGSVYFLFLFSAITKTTR